MESKMRQGIIDGALLALLIIFAQPFYPTKGLIPELAAFLTAIPLRVASMVFSNNSDPLLEGAVVIVYFIVIGALVGIAFERKAIWGWLLLIALSIHHYIVYDQFARPMGEVVQALLDHIR